MIAFGKIVESQVCRKRLKDAKTNPMVSARPFRASAVLYSINQIRELAGRRLTQRARQQEQDDAEHGHRSEAAKKASRPAAATKSTMARPHQGMPTVRSGDHPGV